MLIWYTTACTHNHNINSYISYFVLMNNNRCVWQTDAYLAGSLQDHLRYSTVCAKTDKRHQQQLNTYMHIYVPLHAFILILVQITAGLLVNLLNVLNVTSADNSTWDKWFLMSEKKKGQMRLQQWVKGKGYNTVLWEKLRKNWTRICCHLICELQVQLSCSDL